MNKEVNSADASNAENKSVGLSVDLDSFDNSSWSRGRIGLIELIWIVVSAVFVNSWLPGSRHRVWLLRLFGADIGTRVIIKPRVQIKFPWRLSVGDYSWIGERVWIDNLAHVIVGKNACISQEAYLCTGSHDWTSASFDLIVKSIEVHDSAWVAARTTIGPGVIIGEGAVLGLGSTATENLNAWTIHVGSPAKPVKDRIVNRKQNPND